MNAATVQAARQMGKDVARKRHDEPTEAYLSDETLVPIRDISVPTDVKPSTRVDVELEIANNADLIFPTDPDSCSAGIFLGYFIEVRMEVDGVEQGLSNQCIGSGGAKTYNFSFTSPTEPQDVDVTIEVLGGSSGNLLHTVERTITVRSDAPEQEDPDSTDGSLDIPILGPVLDELLPDLGPIAILFGGAALVLLILAVIGIAL